MVWRQVAVSDRSGGDHPGLPGSRPARGMRVARTSFVRERPTAASAPRARARARARVCVCVCVCVWSGRGSEQLNGAAFRAKAAGDEKTAGSSCGESTIGPDACAYSRLNLDSNLAMSEGRWHHWQGRERRSDRVPVVGRVAIPSGEGRGRVRGEGLSPPAACRGASVRARAASRCTSSCGQGAPARRAASRCGRRASRAAPSGGRSRRPCRCPQGGGRGRAAEPRRAGRRPPNAH